MPEELKAFPPKIEWEGTIAGKVYRLDSLGNVFRLNSKPFQSPLQDPFVVEVVKQLAECDSHIHRLENRLEIVCEEYNAVKRAAGLVRDAVENEGANPGYHRLVVARVKKEWPTLWKSIQEIQHILVK
jgi:hypothetical protein